VAAIARPADGRARPWNPSFHDDSLSADWEKREATESVEFPLETRRALGPVGPGFAVKRGYRGDRNEFVG